MRKQYLFSKEQRIDLLLCFFIDKHLILLHKKRGHYPDNYRDLKFIQKP